MSYLNFSKIGGSASGLTDIHGVTSSSTQLGVIKWYAPWRKYCFFPANGTLFDPDCLAEIAGYVRELTSYHKQFKGQEN